MSNQPSIKKNFILKILYELLAIATPLITAPYVSRVLGADGVGVYSYAQSCITYFTMFAVLGTNSYGMREIARCRNDKEEYSRKFWEIELLTVFTSTICIIAWLVLTIFSGSYKPYFIALLPTLFASMFDISWFYTGHERVGYTVFFNSICKISGVASIFLFVKCRDDLVLYIFLNSIIAMVGNLSMWLFLPKMLNKVSFHELRVLRHFKETLVYFIPTISASIYTVLDKTLIGIITNDSYQNGYYEQATKIINMAKTVVFVAVNSVMSARMSFLFYENRIDEIKEKMSISFNFIMTFSFAAVFGIIGVAKTFVPIFFGEGYDQVIQLLYMMSPLIIIIGISNFLGNQYYTPVGKTIEASKYMIIGSCANLATNIILIPFLGASGAVIGSIIAELIITILFVANAEGFLTFKYILQVSWKKMLAGLLTCSIVIILGQELKSGVLSLLVQMSVGAICYFIMLYLLRDRTILMGIQILKKEE